MTYVSGEDSPVYIVHGDADRLVPCAQSVSFARALKDAGVDAHLTRIRSGGHGGFRNPEITRYLKNFLDHHLYGASKPEIPESLTVDNQEDK